jgi:hypothetical protein
MVVLIILPSREDIHMACLPKDLIVAKAKPSTLTLYTLFQFTYAHSLGQHTLPNKRKGPRSAFFLCSGYLGWRALCNFDLGINGWLRNFASVVDKGSRLFGWPRWVRWWIRWVGGNTYLDYGCFLWRNTESGFAVNEKDREFEEMRKGYGKILYIEY